MHKARKPLFSLHMKKRLEVYIYLVPALGILAFAVIYPWLWSFSMSFQKWRITSDAAPTFIGLANYIQVFQDRMFLLALKNSVIFMIFSVAAQFLLGFGVALLLNRKLPLRKFLMVGVLLPYMLTPAMAGLVWKMLLHSSWGVLNHYLRMVGFPPVDWLGDPSVSLITIGMIATWLHTPWVALMLFAGLQAVPEELFEAAKVDGATDFQLFRYVTLPSIKKLISIVVMFRVVFSLREFDVIYALFNSGGPGKAAMVLGVYLYDTFNMYWNIGQSSAVSFIILFITLALSGMFLFRRNGR